MEFPNRKQNPLLLCPRRILILVYWALMVITVKSYNSDPFVIRTVQILHDGTSKLYDPS